MRPSITCVVRQEPCPLTPTCISISRSLMKSAAKTAPPTSTGCSTYVTRQAVRGLIRLARAFGSPRASANEPGRFPFAGRVELRSFLERISHVFAMADGCLRYSVGAHHVATFEVSANQAVAGCGARRCGAEIRGAERPIHEGIAGTFSIERLGCWISPSPSQDRQHHRAGRALGRSEPGIHRPAARLLRELARAFPRGNPLDGAR